MRKRRSVLLVLIAAVAVWPQGPARADDGPAVNFTTATYGQSGQYADTLGFDFTALESVEVTMLGFFCPEEMANTSTEVGLWTNSGSAWPDVNGELARATGDLVSPKGLWVWAPITPVTLEAGKSYVVGGFVRAYSPVYGQAATPENWSVDPRIQFGRPRSSIGSTFYYPGVTSGTYYGNFGGNLMLKGPDVVPEPGLIQLPFLLAMGAACAWRRRAR